MGVSTYSYVGPMIRIPKKNVNIDQRSCINNDCYKKGHVTDANFCPLCGEKIGVSTNSVKLVDSNWSIAWQGLAGIQNHINNVALSYDMTGEELHNVFEDYFITLDYNIVHENYKFVIDAYDDDSVGQFTPETLSEMFDKFKEDEIVKMFIAVLSLTFQEEVSVVMGHKLYSN